MSPPLDVQVMPDGMDEMPGDMPPEEPQQTIRRPSRQPCRLRQDNELATLASDLIELVEADNGRAPNGSIPTRRVSTILASGRGPFRAVQGCIRRHHRCCWNRWSARSTPSRNLSGQRPGATKMFGDETPEKVMLSKRVKEEMNYQLAENSEGIPERD
jgi:hypothetical protein